MPIWPIVPLRYKGSLRMSPETSLQIYLKFTIIYDYTIMLFVCFIYQQIKLEILP